MIYHLKLIKPMSRSDEYLNAAVIVAANESEARLLASSTAMDEGRKAWIDPTQSTCVEVDPNGVDRIVILDTHAY